MAAAATRVPGAWGSASPKTAVLYVLWLCAGSGDGVTIPSWAPVDVGNCDAYAGTPTGSVTPTHPVTVCCL